MHRWESWGRSGLTTVAVAAALLVIQVCLAVATPAAPAHAATAGYNSLPAPRRLLDTRPGQTTADGEYQATGALGSGKVLELQVAGRAGLPADPAAVVLNVTVTAPVDHGFVTVYPCGRRPNASTVNYAPSQTVPNSVVATVSAAGTVCLYTYKTTHVIVDASGWFDDGAYRPLPSPQRVLDTRPGQDTADGRGEGAGLRPAGSITEIPVDGRVGLPKGVDSVVLNVTVTEPHGPGFVTAFPCEPGAQPPNASNINYLPGRTVPNMVVSKVGSTGRVCLYTYAPAHLVVDVSGSLPASTFAPTSAPQRLLDTRGGDTATIDGGYRAWGTQPWNGSLELKVTDRGDIPADASAVVLNVTAVGPSGAGFLTVHPRGTNLPTASNVNYGAGDVVANAVVARVGRGGRVCLYNFAPTDIVVDVAGYLTGPPPPSSGAPCPSTPATEANVRNTLVRRPALHTAIGVDRIAVLPCGVGQNQPKIDGAALATWLNETVTPWFVEVSGGQYRPQFEQHPLKRVDLGSTGACLFETDRLTDAPFTNVIAVTEDTYGGGQAGPGSIWSDRDLDVLSRPPSQSSRGGYVGGGAAFVDPTVFIHEIGHTIHWPHSYISSADDWGQYTNPVDIMSGQPDVDWSGELEPPAYCPSPMGGYVFCWPQHTMAFNRLAAGWLTDGQVAIHRSGATNYTLAPPATAGLQMVALPDPFDPRRLLTVEARPTIGWDRFNDKAGVAVHFVDQSGGTFEGISTQRRQSQATSNPESYDHVIAPGESLSVAGVTISVYAGPDDGAYRVMVRGTYRAPALPADLPRREPASAGPHLAYVD